MSDEPRTWEEAARQAAQSIKQEYLDRIQRATSETLDGRLDCSFDELQTAIVNKDQAWTRIEYRHLGSLALVGYVAVSNKHAKDALDHVVFTIAAKQHDYGHENISAFGSQGLAVRINDKLARLRNLKARGVPANEPMLDTWLDIVGYCIVGLMWEDGTFMLPLRADAVHGPTTPGHPDYMPATDAPPPAPFKRADLGEIRAIVEDTVVAGLACNAWVRDVFDEMFKKREEERWSAHLGSSETRLSLP